jgi:hypothetical protein
MKETKLKQFIFPSRRKLQNKMSDMWYIYQLKNEDIIPPSLSFICPRILLAIESLVSDSW